MDAAPPYKRYLYLDTKIHRLQRRWGRLESYLADRHAWLRLTAAEQNALPAGQELRDIDGMLELLFEQREALLMKLAESAAALAEA